MIRSGTRNIPFPAISSRELHIIAYVINFTSILLHWPNSDDVLSAVYSAMCVSYRLSVLIGVCSENCTSQ
jgi:hypothetical protein